ncbi:MAG: TIR domain-containing protein [Planctomycetaceae bacterium]|nr:TIR domain-containing protein [Planctomycetaceae bacterium]
MASLLDVSSRQLNYLLYVRGESERYIAFSIPKRRGGIRQILAPHDDLRHVQHRLAEVLNSLYAPPDVAHGFVAGRSILSNADAHVRRRHVLNVDLEGFFPSINFGRVRGMLLSPPYSLTAQAATVFAQICCHNNELPQGAPTSPVVSNMICRRLDRQLSRLAGNHGCGYTRYVDDLTFSRRTGAFPPQLARWGESRRCIVSDELRCMIEENGFSINPRKTWLFSRCHRQEVTGLTVNTKRNVPRKYVRQIRAMIHAWSRYGIERAGQVHAAEFYRRQGRQGDVPPFALIVRGKLEFLRSVKGTTDPVYKNLQSQLVRLDPAYLQVMLRENAMLNRRDVFISHASEDKDVIARPLAEELIRLGLTVWFDEYEISIGDSLRQKIDDGLSQSAFGVVVLSHSFFAKRWTRRELDGLTAQEDATNRNRILPVWHEITHAEVSKHSPTLAGVRAARTSDQTVQQIAHEIAEVIRNAS